MHESVMHRKTSMPTRQPTVLNADAPAFHPDNEPVDYAPAAVRPQEYGDQFITSELTRFLLNKDLLLSNKEISSELQETLFLKPFFFFVELIRNVNKVKNGLGIAYETNTSTSTTKEKTSPRKANNRHLISVKKTQVSRCSNLNDDEIG
ncbi:hypothetical protein CHS0354_029896 [Potamilus streckersoni]|uniref:Uncharacterized protein n=1 Tax=Potamilus streckersoni TaxID=2493646 RepID=A0AAE0RTH3_9BIVA|nr:hypothetical protein CHS0354_029896 [Potamilus streckersoni]